MNAIRSIVSDLFQSGSDVVNLSRVDDLPTVAQANVPSTPRLQGSMPSTRSELTISSKQALSPRRASSKDYTRQFLNEYDHVEQDPIQVPKSHALFPFTCHLRRTWLSQMLEQMFANLLSCHKRSQTVTATQRINQSAMPDLS